MLFYHLVALVTAIPLASAIGERALINKIRSAFEGVSMSADFLLAKETVFNTPFTQFVEAKHREAINGKDYDCEESLFSKFYDAQVAKLSPAAQEAYEELWDESVDFWPFVVALYSKKHTSFYPGKQQGQEYRKWMNVSQKFWDVSLKDVSLWPITGKVYSDAELLLPAVQWIYGINATEALELIDVAQETMAKYPKLGPNFPLWSLNAVAAGYDPSFWPSEFVNIPAVLMGDGLTIFLKSQGIAEAGADFVLQHEQCHQIQFGMNIAELYEFTIESGRYIELLADSCSAYFLHHPRGASFQTKRILQASAAAFSVGDCGFNYTGHHGTPKQRSKAVFFATNLIDNAKVKGKKLKASEFKAAFDGAYSTIVAPDKFN